MGRQKQDKVKQSVGIARHHYDWIAKYADEHGIEITAAVNTLLRKGIKLAEAEERAGVDPRLDAESLDENDDQAKRSDAAGGE